MEIKLTGWLLVVTLNGGDPIVMQDSMPPEAPCQQVAIETMKRTYITGMPGSVARVWCVPRFMVQR